MTVSSDIPPMDPTKKSQVIALNDGRLLGYAEYGLATGTPIVFLPGSGETRVACENLHAIAHKLGIRLISPERPGLGLSSPRLKGQAGYDSPILGHADDIATLVVQLGVQSHWGVIGGIGGGPFTLACAYRASEVANIGDDPVATTTSCNAAAWAGLHAVGSAAGVGPPLLYTSKGTYGYLKLVNFAVKWLPGFANWLCWSIAGTARNPDPAVLERKVLEGVEKLLPPDDVELLRRPEVKRTLVEGQRETYRQGYEGPANDLTLQVEGFKEEGGNRGWGFDVREIKYKGHDGTGVQLWYGSRDKNVPTRQGRVLEKSIEGSVYHEWNETHLGLGINKAEDILKGMLTAMQCDD